jgi:PAS domain S-box-containing protein
VYTDAETRVLLAAATAKDGEITRLLLKEVALKCLVLHSLREVAREVDGGVGTIVLTEEAFRADGFEELLDKLDMQPSWSDIPVVVLMKAERGSTLTPRVLNMLRNVTLLERPAPMRSVVSAIQAAVRGRERQYLIREQIEAIRQGQERFQTLANSIPQLAWMARPDGSFFWYNQRWHQYCGSTPEEMEGWGWTKVHDPTLLPGIIERWKAATASGDSWEDTFPLRRHDGQMRWHLSRAMPLRNSVGKIVLWFGTNTDIEEQRRIAEERDALLQSERAARSDAERAGRLKDEFLATLSHELRTPLTAILGWTQIVRRHNKHDGELDEALVVIERNARVQAQLIEDMLDMSRIISGKLRVDVKDVNIADVARAAIESVRPAAEAKEIRLEKIFDQRVASLRGDPARLQQVIWNLLSNAIKFTPPHGKVSIALRSVNRHLEIAVHDSGAGIKADFLPYVFERFRQADASTTRKHGGLGLGLAIVKSLVELHGGRVRATSPGEGMGATFTIELPLTGAETNQAHAPKPPPGRAELAGVKDFSCDPHTLAGLSVLVLDDEEDARVLISRVLEECGAKVMVSSSGAEALKIIEHEHPTVVLSDIGMPTEDGYEFIRKLRRLPKEKGGITPAAALTAFARLEDKERALAAGYQRHIAKPVEPTELVGIVAGLAGKSVRAS